MALTLEQKKILWNKLINATSGQTIQLQDVDHLETIKEIMNQRIMWNYGQKDISFSNDGEFIKVIY